MDRILFWLTVLGTLSIFRILVESENEEILRQQTPDDDGILYRSKNIMQLIMNPKNSNAPCDLQLKICGIDMCVSETIGNSEYVEISSKSSVTGTNKKQVSHGAKKCFCSDNEPVLFVTQEVADKHFVEYRVQEVSESDGISVVCDWKLNIFTRIPNENDFPRFHKQPEKTVKDVFAKSLEHPQQQMLRLSKLRRLIAVFQPVQPFQFDEMKN